MKEELKNQVNAKLDQEFVYYMLQIQSRYGSFNKHEKIRIEQWAKKLCQVTANVVWKKNRNLYAMLLLDMVLRERLDAPFAQIPPEGSIPVLSFHQVKSKLSKKFMELKRQQKPGSQDIHSKIQELQEIQTEYRSPDESTRLGLLRSSSPDPRGSPISEHIRRLGSPHRSKISSPSFEKNYEFQSLGRASVNESLAATEPDKRLGHTKGVRSVHNLGQALRNTKRQTPSHNSRMRSKSPNQNVNRIVDKVRKKIGQNKRNLDNSMNFQDFRDTQTLGGDVRVCSSRNSMADSLTGTAYFKKTSGGTSVKQEAVESSRAIKARENFQKKKMGSLHSEPAHYLTANYTSLNDSGTFVDPTNQEFYKEYKALRAENTRLKTENEVHAISIKHLKSDLQYKENQLSKQTMEIAELISQMSELKHQNHRLQSMVRQMSSQLSTQDLKPTLEEYKGKEQYGSRRSSQDLALTNLFMNSVSENQQRDQYNSRSSYRTPSKVESVNPLLQQESFYQYLQDFQRETQKLNKETEDVLLGTRNLKKAVDSPPQREVYRSNQLEG